MPSCASASLLLLLLGSLAGGLCAVPGRAQHQTMITISTSSGRSTSSAASSLVQATAINGAEGSSPEAVFIGQNVRRIQLPEGGEAYQILDINRPFGSYSERVSREREQNVNTRSFSSFSSLGYSVFHQ